MQMLTQHASSRMQQRGIKPDTVDVLLACGAREYDHCGAALVYFDKQARKRVLSRYGFSQYRLFEGQLNAYAVLSEGGTVVTVGHRTKRINRH